MQMNIKGYLLSRADSTSAWIGFVGFVLEILLHMGNVSTIMLVLFAALIVLPETKVREVFADWTKKIKDSDFVG
jgi:hypothetical protein